MVDAMIVALCAYSALTACVFARGLYVWLWPVVAAEQQTQIVEIKIFRAGDSYSAHVNKGSHKWALTSASYPAIVRESAARAMAE